MGVGEGSSVGISVGNTLGKLVRYIGMSPVGDDVVGCRDGRLVD